MTLRRHGLAGVVGGLLLCSLATAQQELRWKFTPGQTLAHNMNQDTTMSVQVGTDTFTTTMTQTIDGKWTVTGKDAQGNAQVTQEISRIRMKMQGPQGVMLDIDTASDQAAQGLGAMIAPALKAMAQAKFNVTVSPQGEVLDIDVPQDVLNAFKSLPGAEAMGRMFTEEGFANMIKQGTPSFPSQPLTTGTNWSKAYEMAMPGLGTMAIENVFTYAGQQQVSGKQLEKIDVKMNMQIKGNQNAQEGGVTISDQKSDGVIYFDNEAGRMTESRIEQAMTLQTNVGGQKVDQKINQVITATLSPQ